MGPYQSMIYSAVPATSIPSPNAQPDFFEPRPGVGAVNRAPQKTQALGYLVAVSPNVVLGDLGAQGKKTVHARAFGEDISGMAKLRGFDNNGFLDVENAFLAKQVDPARPA